MNGLLGELSKKLAERWLSLLVLPGVLYISIAAVGRTLGHSHALSIDRLIAEITGWVKAPIATTVGGQVVILVAVLAGAAGTGLLAQALGSVVERSALAAGWRGWPGPLRRLASWRVGRRRCRWNRVYRAYHTEAEIARAALMSGSRPDPAVRHRAYRQWVSLALEEPDRPTWSGDRIHAVAVRLDRDYQLDLMTVWPYLWLHLPEPVRTEIINARQGMTRASTLGGWAILYAVLTPWWWPAAVIATTLGLITRHRLRSTVDMYALLLEATVRLHTRRLAIEFGLDHTGPLTATTGDAVTRLLHTEPPPPAVQDGRQAGPE